MESENVLITGASGFLGCRLAERLALGTKHRVTAMVHRFSGPGIARLARLPVKLVAADVRNLESLLKTAENCDIIIHLAYGSSGDEKTKREITVSGTENVLQAAMKRNVRKMIHFSTAAVHGSNPKALEVNESSPIEASRDVYIEGKIEAEKLVWKYHREHGLPVVVFRPPLIYGPYGFYWTTRIVQEIHSGAVLVDDGKGAANLIYVDNLIDAVFLAMEKDAGEGEAFIVVDDDRLTWRQVYEAYADKIGNHPPIRYMSEKEIEAARRGDYPNDLKSWVVSPFLLFPDAVKTCLQSPGMQKKMMDIPWLRMVKDRLPKKTVEKMKYGENPREVPIAEISKPSYTLLPNKDLIELYSSHARFSNEKIKKTLGYEQRIPFSEAMDLTYTWLKYQRLVS